MSDSMEQYSYQQCLDHSQKVCWSLADFDDIELDFNRPFLPDRLAQVTALNMLSSQEKLWLNQIRGYTYAYLFRFLEEYILGLVSHLYEEHNADVEKEALYHFMEEEVKHQQLFSLFEKKFLQEFPSHCEVVGNMRETSKAILEHSRLSVLYLTSMLEWLTQAHFQAYFEDKEESKTLDESFKRMFRFHWMEEVQHAKLDTIEILRYVHNKSEDERVLAYQEFIGICEDFCQLFIPQVQLDIQALERISERSFSDMEKTVIQHQQVSAYRYTFIILGLKNKQFRKLIYEMSPQLIGITDQYIENAQLIVC